MSDLRRFKYSFTDSWDMSSTLQLVHTWMSCLTQLRSMFSHAFITVATSAKTHFMNILDAEDMELNETNDFCTRERLIESTRQCIWDNAFTPEVVRWYLCAQACLAWQQCRLHYCIKSNPITASLLPSCPERCLMQAQKCAILQCFCV